MWYQAIVEQIFIDYIIETDLCSISAGTKCWGNTVVVLTEEITRYKKTQVTLQDNTETTHLATV